MKGERLGNRGIELLRDQLTERDVAVVHDVANLKLLSAKQIQSLQFPAELHASPMTAGRTCRRVLDRLTTLRLLTRLDRRIGGVRAGSSSFVYAIGPVGQRLIDPVGTRKRFREPTATFVHHTLAIADLVVQLRENERAKQLDVLDLQAEPNCWRPLGNHRGNVLRPDLFVKLGVGDFEYHSFVEIDLGTEGLPRLLSKCQIYDAYYESGVEQATHDIFPKVVWLLDDERRANRLRDAIATSRTIAPELFVVSSITDSLSALSDESLPTKGGVR